jgi:hypothetical protein
MSKLWLIIYHPFQRLDGGSSLPQDVRDKLFLTSLENCEYSILLETEEKTKRWGWLFRTYTQWHAIAFMLSELTVRTKGPEVERAWKVIDYMMARRWSHDHQPDVQSNKLKSHLWKPLRRLMDRARKAHDEAVAKDEQGGVTSAEPLADLERTSSIMKMNLSMDRLFPEVADPSGFLGDRTAESSFSPAVGITPATTASPAQPYPLDTNGLDISNPPSNAAATDVCLAPADLLSYPTMSTEWLSNGSATFTGDTNFVPDLNGSSATNDSPLMPDGSVNWQSWDDLVQMYGMDIDSDHNNNGQPGPYGSTFSSLTQWY